MKKSRRIYVVVSWALVSVCMGIIFLLSAQNAEESSDLSGSFVTAILEWLGMNVDEGVLRTFAHMLEFMGLSVLIFNAVYATWETKLTPVIAFSGAVLYAVTDELHQIFIPGRAFQISDIAVDSLGALIGAAGSFIILKVILTINERRNKNGNTKAL